ncbi:hypothetical protein MKX01_002266 [Papaver californicum]|nr:hypothetical protein MKX01_002266 [Papaver californicum]
MPTLLGNMSSAFKELAASTAEGDMELRPFAQACSSITALAGLLGPFFTFAVTDIAKKVDDMHEASNSFRTLISMMEADIEQNNFYNVNSHSRNLLRVKRITEMVTILFEKILSSNFHDEGDNSWASKGLVAYSKVFDAHHGAGLQGTLRRYACFIPTTAQFLVTLEEDEASCREKMGIIVEAATLIIQYINNLFVSRGLALDS